MVSFKGKSNFNKTRIAEDQRTTKNVGIRNFKVYSDIEKIKVPGSESVGEDTIKAAKKPIMKARKSVPVAKGVLPTDLSVVKGNVENSEKCKGAHDKSVKIKVGRKVLADVSNVGNYMLRNRVSDGSKPLKGKSERSTILERVSAGPSTRGVNASSRKPVLGKTRANQSQGSDNLHTYGKVDIKDFKAYFDNQKGWGYESISTNGRVTARRPSMLTRKSLPVTRRATQNDSSDVKGNAENSEKVTVKAKIGRKVMPEINNARSYFWRNRATDDFLTMAQEYQGTANAYTVSKKPAMPNVRTTLTASKSQTTSKLKCTMGSKTISTNASSSKDKEEVMSSAPDNIPLVVQHESNLKKLPTDGNSHLCTSTSDSIPRSKCNRRRSYTSLLMARSKIVGEHAEVFKQEELPSIDNTANQLEVAEYVDEIYQYYWFMEAQSLSVANYMTIQAEITPKMRGILINWLIEVHLKFDLMQETLFLMVMLFDRFLSMVCIKKNEMQLVGLTSLLLASKYEDFWHPKVKDLISIAADSYTGSQMLEMEKLILKKLVFRLNVPTPYVFMLRFLKAAQSDRKLEHLAFYLIELCLVEYEALKFKPSLLCASAIYVARCTLHMAPTWTTLLEKHACYEESQLKDCSEMILRFLKAADRGILKVTFEKYMCSDHSCVAAIKPVDRLPQ